MGAHRPAVEIDRDLDVVGLRPAGIGVSVEPELHVEHRHGRVRDGALQRIARVRHHLVRHVAPHDHRRFPHLLFHLGISSVAHLAAAQPEA